MRLRALSTLVILAPLATDPIVAQDADARPDTGVVVVGQVLDHVTDGQVPRADISFRPLPEGVVLASLEDAGDPVWEGIAGTAGVFRTSPLSPGVYVIRLTAQGYERQTTMLDLPPGGLGPVALEMVPDAYVLEPLTVTVERQLRLEEAGFFERRRAGWGHTLDREEIEARSASRVSDLFAGIPGTRLVSGGPGEPDTIRLRNDCVPQVIMDGMPFAYPIALNQLVSVYELEAIEVYHGSAGPVQTLRDSCGTVMVWTRNPAASEGQPTSWRRAAVWGALLAVPFVLLH